MESITNLVIPDNISLCVVVVENDSAANCQQHISDLNSMQQNIKFIYLHEPNLGIPIARNRACEAALEQQSDWIAFIDDDETMKPDWLVNISAAIDEYPAEVYYGPVDIIFDGDVPTNIKQPGRKSRPTGTYLKKAATNNTLLDAHFLRKHRSNLYFDESMRFTGGSDTRFFYQVTDLGGKIRWVDNIPVSEHVDPHRMTLRWQIVRRYRCGANATLIHQKRYGSLSALAKLLPNSLGKLLKGFLMLLTYPLVWVFAKPRAFKWWHKAIKLIATSAGTIVSFFGIHPAPYKTIDKS